MCRLAGANEAVSKSHGVPNTVGIRILGQAAKLYLSSKGSLHDEYARLLAFGRRRCDTFLADKDDRPLQFFGLATVPRAFSLFIPYKTPTISDRQVDCLRQWTYECGIHLTGTIICYKNDNDLLACTSVSENRTGAKRKCSGAQIPSHQMNSHWYASGTENEESLCWPDGGLPVVEGNQSRFLAPGPGEQPILHDFV